MSEPLPRVRLLRGDETDLFDKYRHRLRRAVHRDATVSDAIVDDACAHAWLQFLRRQPDRATAFAWLRTVAIHEAWRLSTQERRPLHLEDVPTWEERCGESCDQTTLAAHRALRAVADLPPQQRRYLMLVVAGHTRDEIAAATGATRTNVDKHLRRARRHLRTLQ